jgi:hypothetical protein
MEKGYLGALRVRGEDAAAGQELEGNNAHGPDVERSRSFHVPMACLHRMYHLRSSVP